MDTCAGVYLRSVWWAGDTNDEVVHFSLLRLQTSQWHAYTPLLQPADGLEGMNKE